MPAVQCGQGPLAARLAWMSLAVTRVVMDLLSMAAASTASLGWLYLKCRASAALRRAAEAALMTCVRNARMAEGGGCCVLCGVVGGCG